MAHPIIKWVGGKTQLLREILPAISDTADTYVEPFLGGGAVFLSVLETKPNIKTFILNDLNKDLISMYVYVASNVYCGKFIAALHEIVDEFNSSDDKETFYYSKRAVYNSESVSELERVVLFVFLNKTGYNGLYRVNKRGEFNVPFNKSDSLNIDFENIEKIHKLLGDPNKTFYFVSGSYETLFANKSYETFFGKEVFIYLDPPYKPTHINGSEVAYSSRGFNDQNQVELKTWCDIMNSKGYKFLQSNSDPVDCNFFDELYSEYVITRVSARRNINSDGAKRGAVNEILIRNF